MGSNIRFCPGIQFEPVETDAPGADRNLCQTGPNLGVENVP